VRRRARFCKICSRLREPKRRKVAVCQGCGKPYSYTAGSKGVVCSLRCWGAIKTMKTKFGGRARSGKRADLGGLFVRSRWEANYARYLNTLLASGEILKWEYEPETFQFPVKRGNKHYTPDFKVTLPDGSIEYHEVKGWYDSDSKIKIRRMALHHKNIKIVLIDAAAYKELAKRVYEAIPNWEGSKKGKGL